MMNKTRRCLATALLTSGVILGAVGARAEWRPDPRPRPTAAAAPIYKAYSLVMTNGYGDCYRMNLLRERENYEAYRGICSYRGFSLSGCSTTGEVVMLRIKATPSFGEHSSIVSTSLRWGTTLYVLNDVFRPLCPWVSAGYENWYPFDMSCSVAMYVHSGGYGARSALLPAGPDLPANSPWALLDPEDRASLLRRPVEAAVPKAYSLVMTNGYGDCYRMNLLRERENYEAYRGICSYRGFSLSGCSTTGEVVMLRIKATPSFGEHSSIVSTSLRWGTTLYVLNDVFRPLCPWVSAGYENWYPFDMSCSVAMYINSGGYGVGGAEAVRPPAPRTVSPTRRFVTDRGTGTHLVGALLPLTGDLSDTGAAYRSALLQALAVITNTPGMPPIRLVIEDTKTDAATAYEKLVSLRSNGCHIVLGPESSEECSILKGYANENEVLLLSSSATAVPLAIPDDNLMRLSIDDSHQARELAALLAADGITDIAILSRSDIYGEGLLGALIQEHAARGGTVFATNYCPRAPEFFPEVASNLAVQVAARSAVHGADKVGVVTILFGEGVDLMAAAAPHAALGAVRWYGSDGMAQNNTLLATPAAAAFAANVRYGCFMFGKFTNQLYDAVEATVRFDTGQDVVPNYPMSSYDALCLVAQALRQSGSVQSVASLKAGIRAAGSNYVGCTGPIIFNAADDRSSGTYDFYEVEAIEGAFQWLGKTPALPENVAASQGVYANSVKVTWDPVRGATAYELWGGLADQLARAVKILQVTSNECEVMNVPPGTHCYFWVKAVNAEGTSGFSLAAEGWPQVAVGPGIRINGSSAAMTVNSPDRIVVTVEMVPGVYEREEADWWIVAETPSGWHYRDASGQWQSASAGTVQPANQGPLYNLGATEVLAISGLSAGNYTFYFGVDARDGVLDLTGIWYAGVRLTVY